MFAGEDQRHGQNAQRPAVVPPDGLAQRAGSSVADLTLDEAFRVRGWRNGSCAWRGRVRAWSARLPSHFKSARCGGGTQEQGQSWLMSRLAFRLGQAALHVEGHFAADFMQQAGRGTRVTPIAGMGGDVRADRPGRGVRRAGLRFLPMTAAMPREFAVAAWPTAAHVVRGWRRHAPRRYISGSIAVRRRGHALLPMVQFQREAEEADIPCQAPREAVALDDRSAISRRRRRQNRLHFAARTLEDGVGCGHRPSQFFDSFGFRAPARTSRHALESVQNSCRRSLPS